MSLTNSFGKVFLAPNGELYGIIREISGVWPAEINKFGGVPFAIDECGNYFIEKAGSIYFWDHEINEFIKLAQNAAQFTSGCSLPKPVELQPNQVKSVWLDPEFAKSLGLKVPKDGFIKKP